MADSFGPNNPNWRGGRSIASNGYVIVRKPGHHLADVRGYVYEHRLVAEQKLGRRLRKGESARHHNRVKHDNRSENIKIVVSLSQRANPVIRCKCGCGEKFLTYDTSGRPRRYVSGHNMKDGSRG